MAESEDYLANRDDLSQIYRKPPLWCRIQFTTMEVLIYENEMLDENAI